MLRDLKTNTCQPYRKPNNTPSYIHMSSNHPPEILKRLPTSISELLSRNSLNKLNLRLGKTRIWRSIEKVGISGIATIYRAKSW